jgi:dTDP-4-dehydrorhamnose 3,5-epimerase
MRVEISNLIPDAKFISIDPFRDARGELFATYSTLTHRFHDADGEPIGFVEDDISVSRQDTLRGLHGDNQTWKLMQCIVGEVQLVLVDMRPDSSAHLRWENVMLSETERRQVLVPAGCAVGHLALSERSVMSYKQSRHYSGAASQFTVRWDDPKVGIAWAIEQPRLSERDAGAALL